MFKRPIVGIAICMACGIFVGYAAGMPLKIAYFGLAPSQIAKLSAISHREGVVESVIVRRALDRYLTDKRVIDARPVPLKKYSPIGLRTVVRAITKEQDTKIRLLSVKTGKKMSEIVREAVKYI